LCTYILVEGFLKKQKDSQIPLTTVLENPPLRQIPNYATEYLSLRHQSCSSNLFFLNCDVGGKNTHEVQHWAIQT